jgi:leucyl aminopeptidase (aminopeptidase T)
MPEPSQEAAANLAKTILTQTLRVKKGENVVIESWSETLPWAKPFVTEARKMRANPMMLYEDEGAFWDAVSTGNGRHNGRVGTHEWAALAKTSAYVFFFGPAEWPRRFELSEKKLAGVADYNPEWYQRAAKAKVRGARMYLGRVSQMAADRWDLDLTAWREEMVRASLVSPKTLHQLGTRVGAQMKNGKVATVTHPNGTELRFRFGKYPVQLDDGLVDEADLKAGNNMATIPGGVVGVAIDPNSASGTIVGNHTTFPDSGPVTGTQWTFANGHLTEQSYESGGDPILAAYTKAPKAGRDRMGYFSVGLNNAITKLPQMEDQESGALMFRIGGNSFQGGNIKSPFGAWMVVTGADLSIGGKTVVRGGKIV